MIMSPHRLMESVRKKDSHWYFTKGRKSVWYEGKLRSAQEIMYELNSFPIREDQEVVCLCNVKHCVNPSHLRVCSRETAVRLRKAQKELNHLPADEIIRRTVPIEEQGFDPWVIS